MSKRARGNLRESYAERQNRLQEEKIAAEQQRYDLARKIASNRIATEVANGNGKIIETLIDSIAQFSNTAKISTDEAIDVILGSILPRIMSKGVLEQLVQLNNEARQKLEKELGSDFYYRSSIDGSDVKVSEVIRKSISGRTLPNLMGSLKVGDVFTDSMDGVIYVFNGVQWIKAQNINSRVVYYQVSDEREEKSYPYPELENSRRFR